MSMKKEDYEVGYGKPPVANRFQKGKSGNPKGRQPGSRNFATELDEILSGPVVIREGGKRRTVTVREAILHRLVEKGVHGGDLRAITQLLVFAKERAGEREAAEAERGLSAAEWEILERVLPGQVGTASNPDLAGENEDET